MSNVKTDVIEQELDLIEEEEQTKKEDTGLIEDSEFLIQLDDKYFIRRDKYQFKLCTKSTRINKVSNEQEEYFVNHSYYPVLGPLLINYTELSSKVKAKEIQPLIKEYTKKLEALKTTVKPVSDLVEKLYKDVMDLEHQNTNLRSRIATLTKKKD